MKRDKENILGPQVDLQPVIRAYRFLLRQLSMLLPFAYPLPVFPLLFWDNVAYNYNGFESSHAAPYTGTNEDAASGLPGKPGDTGIHAKPPGTGTGTGEEPGIYKPGALQINTQRFHQDQKSREKISTPGHTLLIEPHMHSMRFLTTYARDNFPGLDSSPTSLPALQLKQEQPGTDSHSHKYLIEERHPIGDFKGKRGGLPLPTPVIGILNRRTPEIKENDTGQGQQNLFVTVPNRFSRSSKESHVINAFKNVRFVNRVVQEAQYLRQKQQTRPVIMIPCLLNVHNQEKNSPESTVIDENKQEYGIGLPSLYTVNRSLGFLNEVVRPTVVQVRLEEGTKAISYHAAEKVHVDHVDHVNYVKFLQEKVSRSAVEFTSIQEIQDKTGNQNTFQTGVGQAISYVPMPAKHFLETRPVKLTAGASGILVRMRTYNIVPSLTSLAFAGNYLQTRLMPTARRAIKSFSGGPGGRFFKKAPLAAGGNNKIDATPGGRPRIAKTVEILEKGEYKIRPYKGFPGGGRGEPCVHPEFSDRLLENSVVNRKGHQGHGEEIFYKSSVSSVSSVVKNFLSHRDHHYHYANAGIMPQLRAAEELRRHVHGYGAELSSTVIVEKIYKTQFTNGSRGSDGNLNFRESRDNQNQKVSNTFNVTMNVDKALSEVWDGDNLQDLGEKLTEILRDEARRYGIKI
jgi:hypothetical protein